MQFKIHGVKNKAVRAFSMVLSICVLCALFSLPSAVSSASSQEELMDIKAHWAEAVILKWVNQGLAKGYGDGRFGPNDSITRAEFVTLLNRIFGYQQTSEKSFPDVKAGAWYAAEIAKAYQAGIIGGDNNGNMNPEAVISRQEAAVILTRAFSLAGDHLDAALKYTDVGEIAEWALGSVGTMTKRGYVTGRPGNLFAPKANLSRCEAVKMIDNVMGELINTGGTYTRVVSGNMVISSPGVTLKDTYIAGDLYLTGGIGTDTIQLIGVAVKGKTIIAGCIESISLTDTILEQDVLVLNEEGKVTITAEGLTEVGTVTICRNAVLSEQDLTGSGFRNIQIAGTVSGKEIVLKGDYDEISVKVPQANVTMETGTVGNFVVDNEATGTWLTAKDGTVIESLNLYAEAQITGGKNIKHAVIASGGIKMDQKPKQVTIAEGGQAIAYHSSQGSTQGRPTPKPTSVSTQPTTAPTPTEGPTAAPTPTQGPTASPTPTQGPTAAPTPTQGPTATPTPTQGPTAAPTPTPGPDTVAPSVPTNLICTVESSEISLSWTASTDNVGVTGYRVYRKAMGEAEYTLIANPNGTTYCDINTTESSNEYTISAVDAAGNESVRSAPVTAVTKKTILAESGSCTDVQNAINKASDGDTVVIPPGEYHWEERVAIVEKAITLQGAGVDHTIISVDNIHALDIVVPSEGRVRVTGIEINGNRADESRGICVTSPTGTLWREFQIDHCKFTELSRSIRNDGLMRGLIFMNEFVDNFKTVDSYALPDRNASWNMDLTLGTTEAIVIEDNLIRYENWYPRITGATASHGFGGRAAWRHNEWVNNNPDVAFFPILDAHGNQEVVYDQTPLPIGEPITFLETEAQGGTGDHRGTRQLEYYNNTHTSLVNKSVRLAVIRGGTFIAFGNVYTGPGFGKEYQMREEDGPDRFNYLSDYPGYDPNRVWMWDNTVNDEAVDHGYTYPADANYVIEGMNLFHERPSDYEPLEYPHPWRNP